MPRAACSLRFFPDAPRAWRLGRLLFGGFLASADPPKLIPWLGTRKWWFWARPSDFEFGPIAAWRPRNTQPLANSCKKAGGHLVALGNRRHRLCPDLLVDLLPRD